MNGYYVVKITTRAGETIRRQIIVNGEVSHYEDEKGNRIFLPKLHDAEVVGDFVEKFD